MIKLPSQVAEYFPYDSVRPHQDEFISTVYNAVANRRSVLIEGSNGLGKTISALSAVLPVAIEKKLKILYVARTHRQHDRVIEELRAVFRKHQISGALHSWTQRNVPQRLRRQRRFRFEVAYGSLRTTQSQEQMSILHKRRRTNLRLHAASTASRQSPLHGLAKSSGYARKKKSAPTNS